jgi:hypothetical protein
MRKEPFPLGGLPRLAGLSHFSVAQGMAPNALHTRYKRHPPDARTSPFPMPDGMVRGTNRRNRAPAWYPVWFTSRSDELELWPPAPPVWEHAERVHMLRCHPQWYTRFAVARSIGMLDSNFYRMVCAETDWFLPQPQAVLLRGGTPVPLWPAARLPDWALWAQQRAQRDARAHAPRPLPHPTERNPQ